MGVEWGMSLRQALQEEGTSIRAPRKQGFGTLMMVQGHPELSGHHRYTDLPDQHSKNALRGKAAEGSLP